MVEGIRLNRGQTSKLKKQHFLTNQFNSTPYVFLLKKLYDNQIKWIQHQQKDLVDMKKYLKETLSLEDYLYQTVEREKGLEKVQGIINANIKDAELTIRNIVLAMTCSSESNAKNIYQTSVLEGISSKCDLLLHYIQFYHLEVGQGQDKIESLCRELLH